MEDKPSFKVSPLGAHFVQVEPKPEKKARNKAKTVVNPEIAPIPVNTPTVRSNATMADTQPKFQPVITLPNGAVIECKKPTNGVRRALLEQPETNLRFIIEIIAAACITKMTLPAGYADNEDESVIEFTDADIKDAWGRLDSLDLLDTQAYIEVFQECNIPSPEMIKQLLDAAKAGK